MHAHRVRMRRGYLLDNQQAQAGQRFDALSELFNPSTFCHLAALGLGPGWRAWLRGPSSARRAAAPGSLRRRKHPSRSSERPGG